MSNPRTSLISLPPEILQHIFNQFEEVEMQDKRNAAATCQTLYRYGMDSIFKNLVVWIYTDSLARANDRIFETLVRNPSFAQCVDSLTLITKNCAEAPEKNQRLDVYNFLVGLDEHGAAPTDINIHQCHAKSLATWGDAPKISKATYFQSLSSRLTSLSVQNIHSRLLNVLLVHAAELQEAVIGPIIGSTSYTWPQLRKLEDLVLRAPCPRLLHQALQSAPDSLRKLKIHGEVCLPDGAQIPKHSQLAKLLVFMSENGLGLLPLLKACEGQLTRLDLCVDSQLPRDWKDIMECLVKSAPTICKIDISNQSKNPLFQESLAALVGRMSSLQHLHTVEPIDTSGFLRVLPVSLQTLIMVTDTVELAERTLNLTTQLTERLPKLKKLEIRIELWDEEHDKPEEWTTELQQKVMDWKCGDLKQVKLDIYAQTELRRRVHAQEKLSDHGGETND